MDLRCPRCKRALRPVQYEDIQIHQCENCSGEWLRGAELRTIIDAGDRKFTDAERDALDEKRKHFTPDTLQSEQRLQCPQCETEMAKYRYGGDSPVVLDRCDACGGTWTDGGELTQVQILAESWEKELASDVQQFGGVLDMIQKTKEQELTPTLESRSPLLRALKRRMLKFWR